MQSLGYRQTTAEHFKSTTAKSKNFATHNMTSVTIRDYGFSNGGAFCTANLLGSDFSFESKLPCDSLDKESECECPSRILDAVSKRYQRNICRPYSAEQVTTHRNGDFWQEECGHWTDHTQANSCGIGACQQMVSRQAINGGIPSRPAGISSSIDHRSVDQVDELRSPSRVKINFDFPVHRHAELLSCRRAVNSRTSFPEAFRNLLSAAATYRTRLSYPQKPMPGEKPLKIILLGPSACGKSTIANVLAGEDDLTRVPYLPTRSIRILETDVKGGAPQNSTASRNYAVQLWDVGGDKQNQQYWNPFLYNADGIIMVYNAERAGQEKDLETIAYFFSQRPESAILKPLNDSRILVIANHHRSLAHSKSTQTSRLPQSLAGKVKELHANVADDAKPIREEFMEFINRITSDSATGDTK